MKNKITWSVQKRKIAELMPAGYNPRTLSDKARADLKESVSRFGQVEPLVVNTDGRLIGGHQRVSVYADLGIAEAEVMVPSRRLGEDEERELNVRLNKNVGEWDWWKLKKFFKVSELLDVGFEHSEISLYFDKMAEAKEDNFDADAHVNGNKNPQAKKGDVWVLGDHRLACGDSTDPEILKKLMAGAQGDMMWTDPPYNVSYNYQKKYGSIHKSRKSGFAGGAEILNDQMKPAEFQEFLLSIFKMAYANLKDSSGVYVCYATRSQEQFFGAFRAAGFHFSQTIIWLKERIILAMGQDYHRIYEPIIYGWKEGKKRWSNKGIRTESEVWDIDRISFEERLDLWYLNRDKSADYIHPTQKPVRLSERAIKKSSPIGGIVLEPFCGSGSALIACEQLKRKCYAIELDPRYVDAILKRYFLFTKKVPFRENDSLKFRV